MATTNIVTRIDLKDKMWPEWARPIDAAAACGLHKSRFQPCRVKIATYWNWKTGELDGFRHASCVDGGRLPQSLLYKQFRTLDMIRASALRPMRRVEA